MRQRSLLTCFMTVVMSACSGAVVDGPDSADPPPSNSSAPASAPSRGNRGDLPSASPTAGMQPNSPQASLPVSPGTPAAPAPSPVVAAPPAAVSPGPAAVGTGRGILGCISVGAPLYGAAPSAQAMSAPFQSTCARCHGTAGEGQTLYPALPGKLDRQAYLDVVRKGRGNMPAFPAGFYSDADLQRDFDAVVARPTGKSPTGLPVAGEWTWSEAQVNQSLTQGLAMFRTPDKEGAACANCHAPDGIDLAVIGYPDAAILRRGAQHLAPAQVLTIVDYVHALRRKFNIKEPCDPLRFRPFQPGGDVLPGATPAEQDLAFGEHLASLGLLVATGKVDSPAAARKAWEELAALDLRKVKLPVALPLWTEDSFNGPEHSSLNDWMPSLPRKPRGGTSMQALFAIDDAYLADPSEDNLRKVDEAIVQPGNMVGGAQPFFEHMMAIKWRSVLLASHFFRMAALGRPGWFDKAKVPFPQFARLYNPFFKQGVRHKEGVLCAGGCEAALASLPTEARKELKPGRDAGDQINKLSSEIAHPWFMLGQLLDQGLLQSENGSDGTTLNPFYWNLNRFPHDQIAKPFINALRVVTQVDYVTKLVGTEKFPRRLADVSEPPKNPLLQGGWMVIEGFYGHIVGESGLPPTADKRVALAVRLKANLMRMFLYQQRELLSGGASSNGLGGTLGRWRDFTSVLTRGPALLSLPGLATDKDFFAGTDALVGEVLGLATGARGTATP